MSEIEIKVLVDDEHVKETLEVADKLRALGLKVGDTIPEIGAIFGTVEESSLPELQKVKGVLEARPEHKYQLPPMDEKIPQ